MLKSEMEHLVLLYNHIRSRHSKYFIRLCIRKISATFWKNILFLRKNQIFEISFSKGLVLKNEFLLKIF